MIELDRRRFLSGLGLGAAAGTALCAGSLRPRLAYADVPASDRKFLFVFNTGGWDPTMVFAPMFGRPAIEMEPDAQLMEIGGLRLVDSAQRPAVRAFFEQHHSRAAVLNGVSVRSLSHDICTMVALTGSSSGLEPDWATRLGDARRGDFTVPHLLVAGPRFTGDLGASVAIAGASGQLEGLLTGEIVAGSDQPTGLPMPAAERVLDRWTQRRTEARLGAARDPAERVLAQDLAVATQRARGLRDARHELSLSPGLLLATQGPQAVDVLASGLARCVTISSGTSWDTHANNGQQSALFEGLFVDLGRILEQLAATPGEGGGTLADETIVVVMSEMGRTPRLNPAQGRDHWPYTSMLLVGPGITGSRMVGGYDDRYYGMEIDAMTGELDSGADSLTAGAVGATLLELAGVDSASAMPGEVPVLGLLA